MTTEPGSGEGAAAALTVAVTGPTGDIGRSLLRVLERNPRVGRVSAMARRPFDPSAEGLDKVEYRRADVLDADAVREVIAGADVVVHLAFMIMGGARDTTEINLTGSRNVFNAAIDAGVARLVYASSVAAYGFGADNPPVLTEDLEPRGTQRHYYSAQKAELELALRQLLDGSDVAGYVFRPCIVAGPDALTLVESIPYVQLSDKMPAPILRALEFMPALRPVIPDPGVPFQLVHHDDVATALEAAVLGHGEPGVYNLAGDGTLTLADLADALGWYSIPVPDLAVGAAAELVARLPFVPDEAQWIESGRRAVIMDTTRARTVLGWQPRHDARETLREMVAAARAERLIR
ncbi:MAG TPA: NAD-dependent epimerase/dehydratase family protein [Solirubrobacteraceae bacterium]|nr:NAD-dependent epimerase/dehydratase family protein [Solirubrobacteraceae bacterium]